MKKLLIILVFASFAAFGQEGKHFTLGYKGNGIVFGNAEQCNGLRLSLHEELDSITNNTNGLYLGLLNATSTNVNGIAIGGGYAAVERLNGLAVGSLAAATANGIVIGGLATLAEYTNGIAIGGMGTGLAGFNGLAISGLLNFMLEDMNGVAIAAVNFEIDYCDCLFNGLMFGVVNIISNQNGMQIGIFNKAKELHGIQIGLWNVAKNNKVFKYTPFINFNFRKKPPQESIPVNQSDVPIE
jgi:hypothetical protein